MKLRNFGTKEFNVDVSICLSDLFDEITDDELVNEINSRGLNSVETIPAAKTIFNSNIEFKRFLCDVLEVGYLIDTNRLIDLLKKKLK